MLEVLNSADARIHTVLNDEFGHENKAATMFLCCNQKTQQNSDAHAEDCNNQQPSKGYILGFRIWLLYFHL